MLFAQIIQRQTQAVEQAATTSWLPQHWWIYVLVSLALYLLLGYGVMLALSVWNPPERHIEDEDAKMAMICIAVWPIVLLMVGCFAIGAIAEKVNVTPLAIGRSALARGRAIHDWYEARSQRRLARHQNVQETLEVPED